MKNESTETTKSASKGEQQKKKLIITGCLAIICLILVIILAVFVLGSCGVDYAETDTNTVYVLKDGKIVSTDIEAFDEKTYNVEKLKNYLASVVDAYNKGSEEPVLVQKELTVEEDVATLILEYANADVYEKVNGVELFTGTIAEAQKAGYTFDDSYAKMKDGKAITATADDFIKGEDYKVIIIKSNVKVVVPGEVCFVSTQNVAKVGDDYVLIKDGSQLLAEEEEEINTEFGTEAEGSDGSVSEDELESGEGDIIFDFGDESNEEESQYSEVLTYIIYK
ncbi:MAG: hypothetical protein IJE49_00085 [Agathobacter sp.]|nr:hypothetical protein [Agathobacter sp.]